MIRTIRTLAFVLIGMFTIISSQNLSAQTQRNPVLEEFTGTWCQWCPCGHTIMAQILASMPNAIMIGYHGPANTSSEPFSWFSGNSVIGLFSVPYWPAGTIDRTGAPNDRGTWQSWINTRNSIPATVSINIDRSFNKITREFSATINFEALTDLSGQFKYTVILLESGIVWPQVGNGSCPGANNYVHKHVVRDMMNGTTGEEIINGTWSTNQVITKTINHTVPSPGGTGPDMVWDSCDVVVLVSKVGSAIYNSEIQQAIRVELVSPDYVATVTSSSPDVIISNNSSAQFEATLYNQGLLNDTYNITATIDGPSGWTGNFTTVNGTFPFGETDSIQVATGDFTTISASVNPNNFNGSGVISLNYASKNDPGTVGSIEFNVVTNTGVHLLVVDATEDGYSSLVSNVLDGFYTGRYGVVSREPLQASGVDLSYFTMIAWCGGNSLPAFYPEEVNNLQTYLDQGGNLLMSGQNIGSDIFETGGQSQFAQSFFNDYLHSNYVDDFGDSYIVSGFAGDPITDGVQFTLNTVYTRSPDEISAFDANTTPIIQFLTGPKISSVRADDGSYKVVYFGFAFEQVNDAAVADSLIARSIRWLTAGIILNNPVEGTVVNDYKLEQNYPNPFNPSTTISYSIPEESQVSLIIYDVMGREVANLVNRKQTTGTYEVEFDASSIASGTYFYKLTAGEFVSVKKMSLLK